MTPADAPPAEPKKTPSPPFRLFYDLREDFVHHLLSTENLLLLGVAGEASLVAHQWDRQVTDNLAGSGSIHNLGKAGAAIGSGFVQIGIGAGFLAIGKATGSRKLRHISWDLIRAQIVAGAITQGLKVSVQRERPNGGNNSFPSGHASATFATASALHQHFGWRVGIPAYALASYVAASRIATKDHYLSDVIFGSAVGIVAGRTATYHERHPNSRISVAPWVFRNGFGIALQLGPPGPVLR